MNDYFIKSKTYKHKANTDVAFMVYDKEYLPNRKVIILKGFWMNITSMNKIHTIALDTIAVKSDEVNNWEILDINGEE